jgi:uncharacterized metal-binding protein YceD (DUF177 family)
VDRLKDFVIQFAGFELGNHQLSFKIDDSFFENFEYSQVRQGEIKVSVEFEKKERMLLFDVGFEGKVLVNCDRCNEEFYFPVSDKQKLIVKFGNEYSEADDEVIIIPETEHRFNLAPYIYEFIHLALPARIIHTEDANGKSGCDEDMLRRIEQLKPTSGTDSRWDTLKGLNAEN